MSNNHPKVAQPATPWRQIDGLYHDLLLAFYKRQDRTAARRIAPKLSKLIASHDPLCQTVLGASSRSLLAELQGDWWSAIVARKREIELIKRLLDPKLPAGVASTHRDISDRMDLLASLYWNAGDLHRAERTLLDSQRYCAEHRIKFDGADMLRELRGEMRASQQAAKRAS